jgi:hypothetical protein
MSVVVKFGANWSTVRPLILKESSFYSSFSNTPSASRQSSYIVVMVVHSIAASIVVIVANLSF